MAGWRRCTLWLSAALASACADPARESVITALGPEAANVPVGPLHRPGQPCVACHSSSGGVEPVFRFAGTVYQRASSDEPLVGANVRLIDFSGLQVAALTNEAGNFYVQEAEYAPAWPVWARIEYAGEVRDMTSAIVREGSCGACHEGSGAPDRVARISLSSEERSP